jgi:hypothetical protein
VINCSDLVLLTGATGVIGSMVEIFLRRKGVVVGWRNGLRRVIRWYQAEGLV